MYMRARESPPTSRVSFNGLRGFRSQTARTLSHRYGRNADANKVEAHHGGHKDEHRGGVRRRGDDRGKDGDHENRVSRVLPQELWRHNSKQGQKENQNGQFEYEPDAQQNHQSQIEILRDADHGDDTRKIAYTESDEKFKRIRKRHVVTECDARKKEENRRKQETGDSATLMFVERWRDEKPNLIKHYWRCKHDTDVNAECDDQVKSASRMRVHQLLV